MRDANPKVLVIEREAQPDQRISEMSDSGEHLDVVRTTSLPGAVERLGKGEIDVILFDFSFAESLRGLREIKDQAPDIPLILDAAAIANLRRVEELSGCN